MSDHVVVLNAASSSLKFCVYGEPFGDARTTEAQRQIGHRHFAAPVRL